MRFLNSISLSMIIAFGLALVSQSEVKAQEIIEAAPNFAKISSISVKQGEIKEVKLWGLYEELPDGPLLSSDLWRNSNSNNLRFAYSKLTRDQKFTPLFHLVRRAIFSGGIGPENDNDNLAILRFATAINIGELPYVTKLLGELPDIGANENLAIQYADFLLYEQKIEDACGLVSGIKPSAPNKKLLELRAACFALHNEAAAASLALEASSGINSDVKAGDWLNRVINYVGINGQKSAPNFDFNGDNGVNYALSIAAGLKPSVNFNNALTASYIIGKSPPIDSRNAINAARLGLVKYGQIKDIISPPVPVPVPDATLQPSVSIAVSAPVIEAIDSSKIEDFLMNARDFNEFYNLAKSSEAEIAQIKSFSIDNAKNFAIAALINKNKEAFQRFAAIDLDGAAHVKLASAILFNENYPEDFAKISPNSPQFEINQKIGDALIANSLVAELAIEDFWRANLGTKTPASQTLLYTMEDAAKRGAKGETALLANLAMQGQSLNNFDVLALCRIIGALNLVGLNQEAKELATFAILARHFEYAQIAPMESLTLVLKPAIEAPKPSAPKAAVSKSLPKPAISSSKPAAKSPPKPQAPSW